MRRSNKKAEYHFHAILVVNESVMDSIFFFADLYHANIIVTNRDSPLISNLTQTYWNWFLLSKNIYILKLIPPSFSAVLFKFFVLGCNQIANFITQWLSAKHFQWLGTTPTIWSMVATQENYLFVYLFQWLHAAYCFVPLLVSATRQFTFT